MGTEYQYQFDDLFRKIEQLEAVVRSQQTIEVQQERIKQLESALAAAKKNSSNSSKPPSSDIVKPKPGGTDSKDNADNQDGVSRQKQRGGQKGHEGHFRPEFAEEQIDEVIEHTLSHCPSCGTKLELDFCRIMELGQAGRV